ncbi:hypothetical protein PILCRDRAFT_826197 [Piloderma croceum F 1598]|uniref:Uncharacterized protein n=1 Tax=Piloderma croceum (strain F 1598) TaxID=765440 RepID=A0A0C3ARU4_PILCF|nr:hypothetical protein PILCRDRAFT_826197 [Piloderma croceum F 1598]
MSGLQSDFGCISAVSASATVLRVNAKYAKRSGMPGKEFKLMSNLSASIVNMQSYMQPEDYNIERV